MVDFDKHARERISHLELTGGAVNGGLTVLDYFAGKALAAVLSRMEAGTLYEENMMTGIAFTAYAMAKEMLAERNKRTTPQGVVKGVTGKIYG